MNNKKSPLRPMSCKWLLYVPNKRSCVLFCILLTCFSYSSAQKSNLAQRLERLNSYEEKWNLYFSSTNDAAGIATLLNEDLQDSERLELLLLYRYKRGLRDISKGEKETKEALKIARILNKPLQEAMALRFLSLTEAMGVKSNNSLEYANNAISIAQEIKDPILEADIYNTLYFVHNQREKHVEAIRYFLKSAELVNKYGGHSVKNIKSIALARISLKNNNTSLAEKAIGKVDYKDLNPSYKKLFMKLKVEILIKKNKIDSLQFYYNKMEGELPLDEAFRIIADGHWQVDSLDMALASYQKALVYGKPKSTYLYPIYSSIAEIYKKKGSTDSTEFYLKKALSETILFGKKQDEPKSYAALATYYLERNQLDKSRNYALQSYAVASANSLTESLVEITKILSKISAMENQYSKAYRYLDENLFYVEELTKQEALKFLQKSEVDRELAMWSENQEREIAFEVEKKDKAIAMLTTENKLRTLEAKQQRNLRISLLIGSLMLIALLLIVWSRYRLKQKAFKSINEKNDENLLLMKEIHHRVKNNLQIILSLLNAQASSSTGNRELNNALVESQNKIKSMSIIHQNLYNSNNFVSVTALNYLKELIDNIKNSYGDNNKNINFKTNIENRQINMALAVPLGLIVNELITNSYKYAFTAMDKEKILNINFHKTEKAQTYKLEVYDNGQGLPDHFNIDELPSFGMQLVKGLVEQLEGEMGVNSSYEGTRFEIYLRESNTA